MCTEAVKELKKISKTLPSLKISFNGKRILQTDASDCYWGAVTLEEDEKGNNTFVVTRVGFSKKKKKHYHSTYKKILAVKRGIEKFEFYLVDHHFFY